MASDAEHPFMSLGPLYVLLGEVSVQLLCPFFNWVVYTIGSLFILLMFSLAVRELFILMRSHLFILSFMSLALGDVSVRMMLRGMSEIFLPMFSSRTFMVLQLIFKSFIHL